MDRADTIFKLNKFSRLTLEAGFALTDDDDNLGPAIDAALRQLGFIESELSTAVIEAEDVPGYLALLDYYVLDLLSYGVLQADITIGDNSKKQSQIAGLIAQKKAEALKEVRKYGYLGSDFMLGDFILNYLEPESAEV